MISNNLNLFWRISVFFWGSFLLFCVKERVDAQPLNFSVQGNNIPQITIPLNWKLIDDKPIFSNIKEFNGKYGYIIFKKNYLELTDLNTVPKLNEITEQLETFISLDEYEPITFAVYAQEDLKNVSIKTADLINEKGQILSNINIDIRIVNFFPRKNGRKKYKLLPLVLEKKDYIDIVKKTTQQFWINIYIPQTTKEGTYLGKIYFRPENKMAREIKLKVKVIPIKLDKPNINYGIYYNMDNRWKGFYPQNMLKHFIDIK